METLWGLIIIVCGIFISVYGNQLFRLTLAVLGFGLGFILGWWLMGSQSTAVHIGTSLVLGGIGAVLLYSLFRVGIYIAGGVLGLVLGMLIVAVLGLQNTPIIGTILVLGAGLMGLFGNRLSNMIIPLATSAAGGFLVAYGLLLLFAEDIAPGTAPIDLLGSRLALMVFLVIVAIGTLGQLPRPGTKVIRTTR
jgi:hypothetical protein